MEWFNTIMTLHERRQARGEYFTADWLSGVLIDNLASRSPDSFVDLAAGRGSLLKAVRTRWKDIPGSSVEIDVDNHRFLKSNFPDMNHFQLDITSVDFPKSFKSLGGNVQSNLLVCNPPYQKLIIEESFQKILKFLGHLPIKDRSFIESELIFLIQSLKTFPEGSEMAVIVPDYILTSERTRFIRQILVKYFGIYKIIEAPSKIFVATEVKTHLLFLRLGQESNQHISLSSVSYPDCSDIDIEVQEFLFRGDYSYHIFAASLNITQDVLLGDIASISRGNLPMHVARSNGIRPFHTTDFKFHKYINNEVFSSDERFRKTEEDDILVGRVGRNIGDQCYRVTQGNFNFSDCVFDIRLHNRIPGLPELIANEIAGQRGRQWIKSRSKGSNVKTINLKDISSFPIIGEVLYE